METKKIEREKDWFSMRERKMYLFKQNKIQREKKAEREENPGRHGYIEREQNGE